MRDTGSLVCRCLAHVSWSSSVCVCPVLYILPEHPSMLISLGDEIFDSERDDFFNFSDSSDRRKYNQRLLYLVPTI